MARAGSPSAGRDVGVVFNLPRREGPTVLPMAGDVGSQFTPPPAGPRRSVTGVTSWAKKIYRAASPSSSAGRRGGTNGFWSALTLATTLSLPLLFVVEDNDYAISVEKWLQTPGGNIAGNLASFQNLAIWQGDGTQPAETAALVVTAVEHVRRWQGPGLLRLSIPRLCGHSSHDNQGYKSEERLAEEWARDPLPALRDYLVPALLGDDGWAELEAQVAADVAAARDAALAQPQPDPAEVTSHVWAAPQPEPAGETTPNPSDPRRINMVEAVRHA